MCGLLFAMSLRAPFESDAVDAARDTLRHRGPDAGATLLQQDGRVALGHRRLSIIDLSDAGNQPMRSGSLAIVFNGEIYNFRDLRDELQSRGHRFETHSDTEVILHGYREWGERVCDRLHGMFAFALWDDEARTAFFARDRLGQKPLHLCVDAGSGELIAASEIKAIRALRASRGHDAFTLRDQALLDYLVYDYVPEPFTWFREVETLLPGHWLRVDASGERLKRESEPYWTFHPDPDPPPIDLDTAQAQMGEALQRAVSSHMLADVPVGALLSGGLDSTAVVALAAGSVGDAPASQNRKAGGQDGLASRLLTFCAGFEAGDDERSLARLTADMYATEHHETVITDAEFRASLDLFDDVFDQPFADSSQVPTAAVAGLAATYVKVALTGDGGDEVFGGYPFYTRYLELPPLALLPPKRLLRGIRWRLRGRDAYRARENFGHNTLGVDKARSYLHTDLARRVHDHDPLWYARQHWDPRLDPIRRAQWLDLKTYLPSDILVKVDRCAMRHSLETRPPFLDHRLVELMLNMRTEARNPGGERKGLFKRWLHAHAPAEVMAGRKRGFGYPLTWAAVLREAGAAVNVRVDANSSAHRDAVTRALSTLFDAGLVNPKRLPSLARRAKLVWKLAKLNRAIASGIVRVS